MSRLWVDVGPLRHHRDFRLLVAGQLVSLFGSNLTVVAVPYQVYRETHSSLWVGIASLIQLPALIAGSLWGGAFGDRYDRRHLFVLSSVVLGLLSGALALNASLSRSHFVALLVLAALAAGAGGFAGPIRTATIVGTAIAGVLLAAVGLASCYWIDAGTFAVLAVATSLMAPIPPSGDHDGVAVLRAIRDGFRYVRANPTAQAVYLIDLNAMVFGLPRALFPAVALSVYHGGPRVLGLLYAAPGVGALAMAVATGWIAHVRRRGRLVVLVVALWGAAMAVFGAVHVIWIGLGCLAVAGAADVISTVLRNTILQNAITDEYRSRISSIQLAVVTGGPRLGDLESGAVANLVSTEFSIVSGGLLCVVGVLALLRWRPHFWRETTLVDP